MTARTVIRYTVIAACAVLALEPNAARAQATEPASSAPESAAPPAVEAPAAAASSDEAALAAALAADAQAQPVAAAPNAATSASSVFNPDISAIADFALAGHSQRETWLLGAHDPALKGFNLQALELALGATVDPYFRFDGIITLNREEVEIEEVYATTLDLPWHLQVRAGQFLTRFGRMNPTHPHTWDFVDQPFALSRVFGGEGSRGLGAELSWLTPLPWYVELMVSGTTADGAETARSFLGDSGRSISTPLDLLYVPSIKQFFPLSDDWSLAWGLSGAFGPNAQGGDERTEVFGTDLYVKWRPATSTQQEALRLHVEVIYRRRQIALGTLQDANTFATLALRFAQRWDAAARYELGSASLDKHGHSTFDPLDPEGFHSRQRVAAALTFFPSEFSRLRVQGNVDMPPDLPRPIWSAFLALEVAVGPHRPHPF